ncbi:hypothetical protein [Porphyromonas gulae]|nr:hypothetical protein [Porphyromonas gulae]
MQNIEMLPLMTHCLTSNRNILSIEYAVAIDFDPGRDCRERIHQIRKS